MAVKLPTIVIGVLGCLAVVSVPYVATALTPPVASRDAFEAIAVGCTRADVERLLGAPGNEAHRAAEAGHERAAFTWTNADGSGMSCEFLDGRLIAKTADRLK
jgi:hypothetical protein